MKARIGIFISVSLLMLGFSGSSWAKATPLPDSFFGETADSTFTINYDDLDAILNASVLSAGMPSRKKATTSSASLGTRMKNNSNPLTSASGNRFAYEEFKNNEQMKQIISRIRSSLEAVPGEVQLSDFTKREQLAYWLNLYNVTVIDEIIKIYPKKNLEDFITDDDDGLLQKKLLKVAGVELSLNDIQFEILLKNYPDQPDVIYGLHQGYIGSPNIRKRAYTAENVTRALQHNATDFVNSNRGTFMAGKRGYRVSGFYQRSAAFFPNFDQDLKQHLLGHIRDDDRADLEQAPELKANIDDWSVTDIYGTTRNYGGAAATNSAALLDSFSQAANRGEGNNEVGNLGMHSATLSQRAVSYGRFSPDQTLKLKELNIRRLNQPGSVTVTDLEAEAKAAEKIKEQQN
jgi:hypothetical protein